MEYIEVEDAIGRPGLRLVLTAGVPGPWGEAAKAIFEIKKIDYTPVRQRAGQIDEALRRWTGQTSAPVAMYESERARSGWAEILMLAERLEPSPRLIPEDPRERAMMLGLCFEICGEEGLGWSRRVAMFPPEESPRDSMPWKYGAGLGKQVQAAALERVGAILRLLAEQLEMQRAAGSRFLIGKQLSALDIYWATFSNLILPLAPEHSPMPDFLRGIYTLEQNETTRVDPALIEHRDFVFEEFLRLPQDF